MKKYNIIVAVFAIISAIYLLKLNEFSVILLNERTLGKTDLELLIVMQILLTGVAIVGGIAALIGSDS